jgi:hypothetical protein
MTRSLKPCHQASLRAEQTILMKPEAERATESTTCAQMTLRVCEVRLVQFQYLQKAAVLPLSLVSSTAPSPFREKGWRPGLCAPAGWFGLKDDFDEQMDGHREHRKHAHRIDDRPPRLDPVQIGVGVQNSRDHVDDAVKGERLC